MEPATTEAAKAESSRVRAFYELTKPRLTQLVLVSVAAGYILADPARFAWLAFLEAMIGIGLVALGIGLSTIAWARYLPVLAIGILMLFALLDLALYSLMKDVLVCYRCQARHRLEGSTDGYPRFDHERAERYRQEALSHEPLDPAT